MINLTSTSDAINLVTSVAGTIQVHTSFVDLSSGAVTPGRQNTPITSGTTTTIVPSPASGAVRNVKLISIINAGVATNAVTISHTDGTNVITLFQVNMNQSDLLSYSDQDGWQYMPALPGVATSAAVLAVNGRNVVVNGDCSVAQVNGTTAVTAVTGSWPIDMVSVVLTQASKLQFQQVSNKLNSLGAVNALMTTVLASYTPVVTDQFVKRWAIEGFDLARFQYGTPNAKAGSLQIKVNALVAGTYSGAIQNYAGTRSYPFTFTVAANTDTMVTVPNIPGDTGGTWVGATSAGAAYVTFDLGSGANSRSSAGTWQTGNYTGVTGSASLVAQANGSNFTVTDVQLEQAASCTQLERKRYAQVLWECMRCLRPGPAFGAAGQCNVTTQAGLFSIGPLMRATPTWVTLTPMTVSNSSGAQITVLSLTINAMGPDGTVVFTVTVAGGLVAGNGCYINNGTSPGYFGAQI